MEPAVKRLSALFLAMSLWVAAAPVRAAEPPKQPVAIGTGGAAASVNPLATQAAIDVLRDGGNAIDAAVAAAAVLGVVEPYSCGIGGGGFMVVYLADRHLTTTIDSRETAPAEFQPNSFIDPATDSPIPFAEQVTSGLGVGVPGTPRAWEHALQRYGTRSLAKLLRPAIDIAENGFTVNAEFKAQTAANRDRFKDFSSTSAIYLPGGSVPEEGSTLSNPDLAATYRLLARHGIGAFYGGEVAEDIVSTIHEPPVVPGTTRKVRPGLMTTEDLADYTVVNRDPTSVSYRGFEVVSMGPPSSGGTTVGESLNILEGFDLNDTSRAQALHWYLEASRLAYADRGAYLGDPDQVEVPLRGLLSKGFAEERRARIGPTAATSPVPAGNPWPFQDEDRAAREAARTGIENLSTTHLTVADRWGNVVSYTFTIEQTGGSGIVVPGRGFLLNNELTDFESTPGLANSPAAGKRPRSSMSPTIVFSHGRPLLALGSPGGATIITTVLQVLLNRLDFEKSLPEAIAAPRASQRNTLTTQAERAFIASPEAKELGNLGHKFSAIDEIGAATGIEFLGDGRLLAAAEPVRRHGGSAMVVRPAEENESGPPSRR